MPPRSTFKGFIRLSLVSVPVRGFTATATTKEIRLNQLHAECNSRIKYQKVCPTHGEVKSDEIVSGYEYAKDQYVLIDPDEVAKIRKESDKTVEVRGFVKKEQIEPRFFSGRTMYFLPDGPAGHKPYQLLAEAMEEQGLYAIGSAVQSGREQMVALRPIDGLLAMTVLHYHSKVKDLGEFTKELKETKITADERKLTQTLIDASTLKDFDFAAYEDHYTEQLSQIIEAKVQGEEIVAAPEPEEPKIINLMEALKASVESAQGGGAEKPAKKAASKVKTKMAPSTRGRSAAKKRKSG